MVVQYLGNGGFRLQSGELVLLVNPPSARFRGDIVLRTLVSPGTPAPSHEIGFAGEYEIKNVVIQGWPLLKESSEKFLKTVYLVLWEEMRFLFLGHLSNPLEASLLEEIGEPDVVFVPTGDPHMIRPSDAAKLVHQLEPALVLPAPYGGGAGELMRLLGEKATAEEKLVFKKKELSDKKRHLVLLEAKA